MIIINPTENTNYISFEKEFSPFLVKMIKGYYIGSFANSSNENQFFKVAYPDNSDEISFYPEFSRKNPFFFPILMKNGNFLAISTIINDKSYEKSCFYSIFSSSGSRISEI